MGFARAASRRIDEPLLRDVCVERGEGAPVGLSRSADEIDVRKGEFGSGRSLHGRRLADFQKFKWLIRFIFFNQLPGRPLHMIQHFSGRFTTFPRKNHAKISSYSCNLLAIKSATLINASSS